ncbi:MAG: FecR family protein [Saprospiraceae bacterium]
MKEDLYISLLYKKLSQEITPVEDKQLSDWLSQSEANQQIADSVEKAWALGANYSTDVDVDLDADYSLLQKRMDGLAETPVINLKTNKKASPKARPMFSGLRIAASVLFLVLAGFLLKQYLGAGTEWRDHFAEERSPEAVELADGTKVWVNAGSKLSYPEAFDGKERIVKLKGEAFFDVAKDAAHPFLIETATGTVRVLGTSFNVRDFTNEESMSVDVVTGKVRVAIEETGKTVDLIKNQQAVYQRKAKKLSKLESTSKNYAAWHTRKLTFSNNTLAEALQQIEKVYAVKIKTENNALKQCPISSNFNQFEIDDLLENIGLLFGAEVKKEGTGNYVLVGGGCE